MVLRLEGATAASFLQMPTLLGKRAYDKKIMVELLLNFTEERFVKLIGKNKILRITTP